MVPAPKEGAVWAPAVTSWAERLVTRSSIRPVAMMMGMKKTARAMARPLNLPFNKMAHRREKITTRGVISSTSPRVFTMARR